ncbi:MAG TPA: DUF983 domain-containing protein [Alphaproteobacteria bacterium]|nr:DUF983 domain-containing protein [Alphaproteobacteria bacterium]
MTTQQNPSLGPSLGTVLKRAICERCPNCGQGKLYKSYLKQVDRCEVCGEEYGYIRADDGPAWLTILLAGHITVPLYVAFETSSDVPSPLHIFFWLAFITVLVLALLPRTKAVFLSVLWHMKLARREKTQQG